MSRHLALLALALSLTPALPNVAVQAASFDCAKASTPFEKAICASDGLSAADERLAKSYATAIGGLSEKALAGVREDQRAWLDFAQQSCSPDAKPLTTGSYGENAQQCLLNLFNGRSSVLESSRMINGMRFYPRAHYAAMPDPNAEDEEDAPWAVAQHELSYVQLDSEEPFAVAFNTFVEAEANKLSDIAGGDGSEQDVESDASSDTSNSIEVKEVGGNQISLDVTTYWYGHGAAHGNYGLTYLHYLREEDRALEAKDIFTGKRWQAALLDLTVEALKDEHGENLMLDDTSYIADAVTDPSRWDLSDPYALILQFQPYEVSAYAYGAPTARVSWEKLQPYLSETADQVRY